MLDVCVNENGDKHIGVFFHPLSISHSFKSIERILRMRFRFWLLLLLLPNLFHFILVSLISSEFCYGRNIIDFVRFSVLRKHQMSQNAHHFRLQLNNLKISVNLNLKCLAINQNEYLFFFSVFTKVLNLFHFLLFETILKIDLKFIGILTNHHPWVEATSMWK